MNTTKLSRPLESASNHAVALEQPDVNDYSQMALRHAGNGIMVTDADNTITQVNPAFCRISGYSEAEIIGRKPFLLRSGEHDESFYNRIWKILEQDGFWQGEICYRHKDGSLFYVWESISAVSDSAGNITNFVSAMAEMTQLKKQQQALDELANYDALTDLPNRHYFSANLKQALEMSKRQGTKVALLFIDLNKFKAINDHYGHRAGDNLLIEVAHRISKSVRNEDTAARIGGDEFVVLMPRVFDRKLLESIAERILDRLAPPIQINDRIEISVAASIGVSIFPDDMGGDEITKRPKLVGEEDDLEILDLADQAMYTAKEHELPICFYDQVANYSPRSRLSDE